MSICAALVKGEGAYLDVSVADAVVQLMSVNIEEHLATGAVPGHRHTMTTGRYAAYDTYECSDGGWISVGAIEPKFWVNFCNLIGLPQYAKEQTYDALQDQIRSEVAAVIRTKTRDEWTTLLAPADTCVAPVLSVPEVVEDPQLRRGLVESVHPAHGTFKSVGPTLAGQVKAERYEVREGDVTDTDALLADAGLSKDEIAKLHDAGVIA
jgi:alpha-methylacyl-CoA racemase